MITAGPRVRKEAGRASSCHRSQKREVLTDAQILFHLVGATIGMRLAAALHVFFFEVGIGGSLDTIVGGLLIDYPVKGFSSSRNVANEVCRAEPSLKTVSRLNSNAIAL